jgi:hypothetical protein
MYFVQLYKTHKKTAIVACILVQTNTIKNTKRHYGRAYLSDNMLELFEGFHAKFLHKSFIFERKTT